MKRETSRRQSGLLRIKRLAIKKERHHGSIHPLFPSRRVSPPESHPSIPTPTEVLAQLQPRAKTAVDFFSAGLSLPFVARYRQTETQLSEDDLRATSLAFEEQMEIFRLKQELIDTGNFGASLIEPTLDSSPGRARLVQAARGPKPVLRIAGLKPNRNRHRFKHDRNPQKPSTSQKIPCDSFFASCVAEAISNVKTDLKTLEALLDESRARKQKSKSHKLEGGRRLAQRVIESVYRMEISSRQESVSASPTIDPFLLEDEDMLDASTRESASECIAEDIRLLPGLRRKILDVSFPKLSIRTSTRGAPVHDGNPVYLNFWSQVLQVRSHQWLAISRLERTGVVDVAVEWVEDGSEVAKAWLGQIQDGIFEWVHAVVMGELKAVGFRLDRSPSSDASPERVILVRGIELAVVELVETLKSDVRARLTDEAEKEAISLFRKNLREKVSVSGIQPSGSVLAIDPGIRHGNKCAIVSECGQVLNWFLLSFGEISSILRKFKIGIIVVGNGLGGRGVMKRLIQTLRSDSSPLPSLAFIDETGSSVYSATESASAELPDIPLLFRSAVTLARRVYRPIEEFSKIPPQHLGLGLFQKDLHLKNLTHELKDAFDWVVLERGIDVNKSGCGLIARVCRAGNSMDPEGLARSIIQSREVQPGGAFQSREQLKAVNGMTDLIYRNVIGFMMVKGSRLDEEDRLEMQQILDSTLIHPDDYDEAEKLCKILCDFGVKNMKTFNSLGLGGKLGPKLSWMAEQIFPQDQRDAQIVRLESAPYQALYKEVIASVSPVIGSVIRAVTQNVVSFGAFLDVGADESALLPLSDFPDYPVSVGSELMVKVTAVNSEGKIRVEMV